MNNHELYEVLCALAATDQLAAPERADFDEHCLHCPACRDQLHDLISVGVQLQLASAIHAKSACMPSGSLERFRARAIREGIAPRSVSARRSPSFALASAAAVFFVVATLTFIPHGRRAAGSFAVATAAHTLSQPTLCGSVTRRPLIPHPSKAIHINFIRHRLVPHTDVGVNDASLTAQRFPHAIASRYPFFGQQGTMKPAGSDYPALGRSEISRLDLFRKLDDSTNQKVAGVVTPERSIDIAATGKAFDFAANIRQLHFQLSTAQ